MSNTMHAFIVKQASSSAAEADATPQNLSAPPPNECIICLEEYTSHGEHRAACLACGKCFADATKSLTPLLISDYACHVTKAS
jgi:hypothetical protein